MSGLTVELNHIEESIRHLAREKKYIESHIKQIDEDMISTTWKDSFTDSYDIKKKNWMKNLKKIARERREHSEKKKMKIVTKIRDLKRNKLDIKRIIEIKNISVSTQIDAGFEKNIKTLLGEKTLQDKAKAAVNLSVTFFSMKRTTSNPIPDIKYFEELFVNVKAGLYKNINKKNKKNPECWEKLLFGPDEPNLSRFDPAAHEQSLIEPLIYKSLVIVVPFVRQIISLLLALISINKINFESFHQSDVSQFKTQLNILEIEYSSIFKNIKAVHCIWFLQCIITMAPEWINTQKNKTLNIVLMKILDLFHKIPQVGKQIGINKYKIDTILQNRGASAKKIQARARGHLTRMMMGKPRRKSIHPGNLHPSDTRHHNSGPLNDVSFESKTKASPTPSPSRWDRLASHIKKGAKRAVEIASTQPAVGGKRKTKRRRRKVTKKKRRKVTKKKRRKQKKTRKK